MTPGGKTSGAPAPAKPPKTTDEIVVELGEAIKEQEKAAKTAERAEEASGIADKHLKEANSTVRRLKQQLDDSMRGSSS